MTSQYVPLSAAEAAKHRTRVTLLGTAGGPPWWDGSDRSGISTAITVNGSVYIIDCGEGWGPQFRKSGLGPAGFQKGLDNMRAVFITHHHSDHMVDYPNLLLLAWHNGSDGLQQPIKIMGPGGPGRAAADLRRGETRTPARGIQPGIPDAGIGGIHGAAAAGLRAGHQ